MLKNIAPNGLHLGGWVVMVPAGATCLLDSEFDPTSVQGLLLSWLGSARTANWGRTAVFVSFEMSQSIHTLWESISESKKNIECSFIISESVGSAFYES